MKLFEIADNFRSLFDEFDGINEEFEGDPDILQGWFDTLEGIEGEFSAKAEAVAQYIKEQKATAEAIDEEIKNLQARKKAAVNSADRLSEYLGSCLDKMKLEKVETPRCKIGFRNCPESVAYSADAKDALIAWAQKVNRDDLLRFKDPDINTIAVKAAIKSGESFPGVSLERKRTITIK